MSVRAVDTNREETSVAIDAEAVLVQDPLAVGAEPREQIVGIGVRSG
jgi:hypothetical protein